MRLWSLDPIKQIRAFPGRELRVTSVAFAPDGKTLAAAYDGGEVRLWDTASGKELWTLPNPGGPLAFSPDGKTLAAAAVPSFGSFDDKTIRLYDALDGKEIHAFRGHQGAVRSLAFAPDGKSLASGSDDTTLLIWDCRGTTAPRQVPSLPPSELATLWEQLADADPARAWQAVGALVRVPRQSVPLLLARVEPVAEPPLRHQQLVADLAAPDFAVREKASAELAELGERAELALVRALDGGPALDLRQRVARLVDKLPAWSGERFRLWRVIQVLEAIGTPEAKTGLEKLAGGAPASWFTREARNSLRRLAQRPVPRD